MRLAILTFDSAQQSSEVAAQAEQANLEVLDFSCDHPVEDMEKADAFVLLADKALDLTEAQQHSLLSSLKKQSARGKPLLGLGWGSAKLLVESGLVPGLYNNQVGLALVETKAAPGETWIALADDYQYNAFTQGLAPQNRLQVQQRKPAAFLIPPGLLAEIKGQGLAVFLYCEADGQFLPSHPIAALSNKAGNVMALPAHPECYSTGILLFQALRAHLESGYIEKVEPLYYWPRK